MTSSQSSSTTKIGNTVSELIKLENEINKLSDYTREFYKRFKDENDEALTIQLNNNMNNLKELVSKRNAILKTYHELFEKYKEGLLHNPNFDPINEHLIETQRDDFLLSSIEMKYQNKWYDKLYDLQYWRLISHNHYNIYDCACLDVLERYLTHAKLQPKSFDVIRYKLSYIPHPDWFILDVYIMNDLTFELPDDLYPESITQELFDKWFKVSHPHVSHNMKRKIKTLIK